MKNLVVLITLALITITSIGCNKPSAEDEAAIAAKAKFDALYNKENVMKYMEPEKQAELLKKFD